MVVPYVTNTNHPHPSTYLVAVNWPYLLTYLYSNDFSFPYLLTHMEAMMCDNINFLEATTKVFLLFGLGLECMKKGRVGSPNLVL
jgi:hypothetical protein